MTVPAKTTEPPLWAPFYGAPFGAAVKRFFTKYATFSGRAGRAEYWWVALFTGVVSLVLQIILAATGGLSTNMNGTANTPTGAAIFLTVIYAIWGLAILIPSLALVVRRLHDTDKAG
ncbi:DUF805 domain-containing protein [Subtercola boreus]|uniref:DUF805 domain-containing protein n=1 Tax=Subtercola boreus TaxID=120213 RepID=UPI0026D4CDA9